jgi:hypothetical protein
LVLPLLTGIKFFDANVGIAFGVTSAVQSSGVIVTRDGGATWQPLTADSAGCWLAGDFLDPSAGAVAGPAGRFATLARGRVMPSPLATASLRSFHVLRLAAPASGWIVGDGGLVMTTSDLGRSWQSPTSDLPGHAADLFDFHALAVHGQKVWIAGSPGTRVFHSPDGGQSWQAFDTGQFTPIRALTFIDASRGWAVGDLGSILATRDAGRTWQVQRAGGRRAALLAVFAEAAHVPIELIAQYGAAESYISAVELLARSTGDAEHAESAAELRAGQAMLLAGAAAAGTAWRFPLPARDLAIDASDLLHALNRANDGRAIQQLEMHLTRQLRMWRPDVVITHHARGESSDPAAAMVERLVVRSVESAADPTQLIELTSASGLSPWPVKKVFGVLPPAANPRGAVDVSLDTTQFSSVLGGSPSEWAAPARALLFDTHTLSSNSVELKLLMSRADNAGALADVFGGIPIGHGSEARRPMLMPLVDDQVHARSMATRRKHLQSLLKRTEGNASWAAQVAMLTEGLDARGGGELLFQLAEGYRRAGRLDLAADAYFLLARRYPAHPLTDRALVWLVQFYASAEMGNRATAARPTNIQDAEEVVVDAATDAANLASADSAAGVQQASGVAGIGTNSPPAVGLSPDDRRRRAVQLSEYLETARPMLFAEPAVRFAEVSAQRQLGFPNAAKRYFLTLKQLPETSPWRRCAATEEWLAAPNDSPPPKSLATCRRALARPNLDGRLDEALWEASDVLRLRGDPTDVRQDSRSEVRLAYDDEFLYFAVSCPKVAGGAYQPDDGPRPRDADLLQHDRVTLQLDLDRDFTTAFEFTVDHRGWCRDECWGDASWNPTWYIAATGDNSSWTVEAAIPLTELTGRQPAAKHVWAASVRRTIPRVGYESWTGVPADDDSPERFGLLIFE